MSWHLVWIFPNHVKVMWENGCIMTHKESEKGRKTLKEQIKKFRKISSSCHHPSAWNLEDTWSIISFPRCQDLSQTMYFLAVKAVPGERDGGAAMSPAGVEPGAGVSLTSPALAKGPGFGWLFSKGNGYLGTCFWFTISRLSGHTQQTEEGKLVITSLQLEILHSSVISFQPRKKHEYIWLFFF